MKSVIHRSIFLGLVVIVSTFVIMALVSGQPRGRRGPDKAPKVGSKAPEFALRTVAGDSVVQLADLHIDKPAVLFFGSYT